VEMCSLMEMRSSPGQEPSVDEAIHAVQLEDGVWGLVRLLKLVTRCTV